MKAGWKTVNLGEILNVQNGYAFDSKFFGTSGMPLIRIRDIKHGTTTETSYSGDYDEAYVVHSGDYLIGMDGEFRCYMWRGPAALLNQRVCRLTNFSPNVLPAFICYGINKYLKEIEDVTGYSTVKHLSSKSILSIQFPLPPLAEQKRIVALLDEAFARIDEAKAKAEAAQSASGKIFESQVGLSFAENNDWKEATLSDLGKTLTGTTPPTANPEFYGEYIPFVKPADFNEDGTLVIDNHGLSKEGEKVARVTNPDSVLMVCIGATIGKTGYTTKRITTNQQINSFTPGSLVNFKFAYYQMISSSFQKEVLARANQATMPMISKSKWSEINLRFPNSYDTQVKVAERLSELKFLTGKLSETADRKVAALNEIRSSLLAQAFNGELTA
jgi:type I restriction enzyme S subunit